MRLLAFKFKTGIGAGGVTGLIGSVPGSSVVPTLSVCSDVILGRRNISMELRVPESLERSKLSFLTAAV